MLPRSDRPSLAVLLIPLLLAIVAACSPEPTRTGVPASGSASGSAAPGGPSASLHIDQPPDGGPPSPAVGQSETAWGRIWDRLPAWFPRYPGSSTAEDASAAPSSARFAVQGGDPRDVAAWLRSGLETATLRTDVSGPLEDGTMTLDSVGAGACRVRTTVTPLGGMTFISVLYGAECPVA